MFTCIFLLYIKEIKYGIMINDIIYSEITQKKLTKNRLDLIKSDCDYFIKNWGGDFMFRGFFDVKGKRFKFKKLKRRKNRIPVDTKKETHDLFNSVFKDEFGWKGRNGVFAINDLYDIDMYEDSYYIFLPIGEYRFIYSNDVIDLYSNFLVLDENWLEKFKLTDKFKSVYDELPEDYLKRGYSGAYLISKLHEKNPEYAKDFIINTLGYTDRHFPENNIEVSFECDEYYLIDLCYFDEINKLLGICDLNVEDEIYKRTNETNINDYTGKFSTWENYIKSFESFISNI